MLGIPMIKSGSDLPRPMQDGDLAPMNWQSNGLATVGAGVWTAALIAGGLIRRTGPVGGYTDTTDTAENIRIALGNPPFGVSFLLLFCNDVAQALTFAAGVGVTTTGTVTVANSVKRLYNVTMVNNTPQQAYVATIDGTTAVLTGMTRAMTDTLSVGMFASGTGIAAASFINSIQPGVGVTLGVNTTGGVVATPVVTFSPVVNFEGLGVMTA